MQKQAYVASQTPSKAETQQEQDRGKYFEWRDAGDFTKTPPSLVGNVNYGSAMQKRRQLEQTATPTGAYGMGAGFASPTALAMQNNYLHDVNAESDANAYQQAISAEDLYQRTGATSALESLDASRKAQALNTSTNMSEYFTKSATDNQPQSLWPSIIGGLISAGGQMATKAI